MASCALCRQDVSTTDALRHGPQEIKRFVALGFHPAPEVLEPWRGEEGEPGAKTLQRWEDQLDRGIGPYFLCPSCFEQAQELVARAAERAPRSKRGEMPAVLAASGISDPRPAPEPNYRWPLASITTTVLLLLAAFSFWEAFEFSNSARELEKSAAQRVEGGIILPELDLRFDLLMQGEIRSQFAIAAGWLQLGIALCVTAMVLAVGSVVRARFLDASLTLVPVSPHPNRVLIWVARGSGVLSLAAFGFGVLIAPSLDAITGMHTWWTDDKLVTILSIALACGYFAAFCLLRLPNVAMGLLVAAQFLLIVAMYLRIQARVQQYPAVFQADLGIAWLVLGAAWVLQLVAAGCMAPTLYVTGMGLNARSCPLCGRILREGATFCTFCKAWIR